MKRVLASLLLAVVCTRAAEVSGPKYVIVDTSKIDAPLDQRYRWVIDQRRVAGKRFEKDYGWILSSKNVGLKEAQQIAYLYFYSTGQLCGYLDDPIKEDNIWKCGVHLGFNGEEVKPILVDPRSWAVWQDGQREKIDARALIRAK